MVASGRKFNLRRDLRWVAKRTCKFPRKYTQVAKKYILRQTISLANNSSLQVKASARKPRPNGVTSKPKFSTRVYFDSVWPGLYVVSARLYQVFHIMSNHDKECLNNEYLRKLLTNYLGKFKAWLSNSEADDMGLW